MSPVRLAFHVHIVCHMLSAMRNAYKIEPTTFNLFVSIYMPSVMRVSGMHGAMSVFKFAQGAIFTAFRMRQRHNFIDFYSSPIPDIAVFGIKMFRMQH